MTQTRLFLPLRPLDPDSPDDLRLNRSVEAPGGVSTAVLRSEDALVRLLPEWWGLWERSEAATPFQSPAWLLPWWRSFRPGGLFVVAVRRHGELVGLAPLYREVGPHGRRLLPIGISASDYLDVLIDPAHRREVAAAIVRVLAASEDEWDSVHLEDLRPCADAFALSPSPGWHEERGQQSACPVLQLRGSEEGPARRLKKSRRRAERRGDVRVVAADAGLVAPLIETLIALHRERWASRGEPGVLADRRAQAFHREAAPGLHAAGVLRLYGLEIAGQFVGAYYGFAHRGRAYGYLSGFDPDFCFESPGSLLLDHAIRQARREGCQEFDFLRGREAYKYAWGAVDRWTDRRVLRHGRG